MGFNRSDIKVSFNNEGTKFYVNEEKGTVVCSVEAYLLVPTNWDSCVVVPGARIIEKGSDIYEALYRELDICRYVLGRKLVSIMVMQNDNVLNAIYKQMGMAKKAKGIAFSLPVSDVAGLAPKAVPAEEAEV